MAYSRWWNNHWYIFWYANEAKKKEDCLLAIWGDNDAPLVTYNEAKEMLENDDWSRIGYPDSNNIPDKDILVNCVKRWLEDVEKEFSEGNERNWLDNS